VHWQRFAAAAPPPEPKRGSVIVGVGQVKTCKGFHVVAEAMQTVRGSFPAAEYVVIGDTTSAPAFADQLAAMPGVRVLGRLDDATLRAWYHHADLLAQTPVNVGDKFEGFGLVFLEAGAAGLPSVGARGSGAEEAILHEETGLLVPQNDPAATTEAILRLLRDDALRARMGESARRHAMANGWDQIAAQVMQVYASALA
jgi:glycosyltransferase involved in cell wall biosynthesis